MKTVDFNYNAQKNLQILKQGAFLTAQHGGALNTMTIAWGSIGVMWGRPVFTALVRKSRFTHELIEGAGAFCVSFPYENMARALAYCGKISGRDADKIQTLGLKIIPDENSGVPILDFHGMHLQCLVLYKHDITAQNLDKIVQETWYHEDAYHTLYFAEITKAVLI